MNAIQKTIAVAALALASLMPVQNVHADGISRGMRGPTNLQLDSRLSYAENDLNVKTMTENMILKYWDGKEFGLFGFVNMPYKYINTPTGSSTGLGDINLGAGPRGQRGDFHWLSYVGITIPAGDVASKPALGNGRIDEKISIAGTYVGKGYEINGVLEHTFTGKNNSGITPPNETSIGIVGGREFTPGLKVAAGLTSTIKTNSDYVLTARAVARYTISPKFHIEVMLDKGIVGHNLPRSIGGGLYVRYNFGNYTHRQ